MAKRSQVKDAIVQMLQKTRRPYSVPEMLAGLEVNKTSIYRQIETLIKGNLISEVDFGDGKKRFEYNLHNHHHHLICTNCNMVEDIFVHNDVKHVEDKIRKLKKFKVQTHSLEFFGLCKECSWKQ